MDWKISKVFPHFEHEYSYVGIKQLAHNNWIYSLNELDKKAMRGLPNGEPRRVLRKDSDVYLVAGALVVRSIFTPPSCRSSTFNPLVLGFVSRESNRSGPLTPDVV
jgi:hypothetical protein